MAKYPKRLAAEAEVKKRIKSRNGKLFLLDARFKHRKLFGGASLSYTIPVELSSMDIKIKFINAHNSLFQYFGDKEYESLFDSIRRSDEKRERFKDLWKNAVQSVYEGQLLSDAVFPLVALGSVSVDVTFSPSKDGIYYLTDLFQASIKQTIINDHYNKFPSSIWLKSLLEELVNTGSICTDKYGKQQKTVYQEYINSLKGVVDHRIIKRNVEQIAQIWRGSYAFLDFCKQKSLGEVDQVRKHHVEEWLRAIGGNTSSRTEQDYLRAVRKAFDFARENRITQWDNPCNGVTIRQTSYDKSKELAFSPENIGMRNKVISPMNLLETVKILAKRCNVKGQWVKERGIIFYSFLVQLTLGLRGNEIQRLTPLFSENQNAVLIDGTKREHSKRIAGNIGDTTVTILKNYQQYLVGDASRLTQYFKRLYETGVLPQKITSHMLRHSFITYEIFVSDRSDAAYRRIMEYTGHSREEVQKIYNDPVKLYMSQLGESKIRNIWLWIKNSCLDDMNRTDFDIDPEFERI